MAVNRLSKGKVLVGDIAGPYESRSVLMSFETGEQTITKIYFPMKVTITKIRGIAMKAIAAVDAGTITPKNSAAATMTGGTLTAAISDPINTEYTGTPTANNTVAAADFMSLTSAKTTAGGKVLVTLEYQRIV